MDETQEYLEQVILGMLMNFESAFELVNAKIFDECFTRLDNRNMYAAMRQQKASSKPIDLLAMIDLGLDIDCLRAYNEFSPSLLNLDHYISQLLNRWMTRKVMEMTTEFRNQIEPANCAQLCSALAHSLETIIQQDNHVIQSWSDVTEQAITKMVAMETGSKQILYTGMPHLDKILLPLNHDRLIVIGGRPGMGKTALAMQVGVESAREGTPVGIISREMGAVDLVIRAGANSFELNGTELIKGTSTEIGSFISHPLYEEFKSYPIYLDENSKSIDEIAVSLSEMKRKYGIKIAVIDYLGLIDGGSDGNKSIALTTRLGNICKRLKELALKLNITIILLSQVTRESEKEAREARMSDLSDSVHIEANADAVFILKQYQDKNNYYPDYQRPIEITCVKNRWGDLGMVGVFIFWVKHLKFKQGDLL